MNDDSMVAQPLTDRERELDDLQIHVEEALQRATDLGADGTEARASQNAGISVNARLGELETIEHHRDRAISVTVYVGRSKGHASSADLRPGSVRDCVQRAIDIARHTEEDKCNGLPDADRLADSFPDLDLWHPGSLDVQQAIDRALECEAAGRNDGRITNSEGASVSSTEGLGVCGNSLGFLGRSSATSYGQVCVLIAGEGDGMQRDYWYDSRRAFEDLEAPAETGREAARRTIARLNARQLPTGKMPVLFAPEVARGIFGHLVAAVSGGVLYRNASFLTQSAGTQLFPEWLTLAERPFLKRAAGSAAFDAEGVATGDRNLVDQGVLTGYVLSSYSARRLGLESTGNAGGIHNLEPAGKIMPYSDLLAGLDRALLVTEVMGQGVRIVTGDYSRGASGFMIENGEIGDPVEEITIAGNLKDMFGSIEALADDIDDRATIRCGSMLVDGMTIAGS